MYLEYEKRIKGYYCFLELSFLQCSMSIGSIDSVKKLKDFLWAKCEPRHLRKENLSYPGANEGSSLI